MIRPGRSALTLLAIGLLLNLFIPPLHAAPAPQFRLNGIEGVIDLNDYRGKVVYVDFWASWCAPCRSSFPWMNEMQRRYQDEGLEIIAINLDKERQLAERFLAQLPHTSPSPLTPKGAVPVTIKWLACPALTSSTVVVNWSVLTSAFGSVIVSLWNRPSKTSSSGDETLYPNQLSTMGTTLWVCPRTG